MGLDFYLDIEGISIRPSTSAFSPGDGYTYPALISGIGTVNYELDPINLTADVGVLSVRCADPSTSTNTDGALTNLFGFRKPLETTRYLDTTITQAESMAGAGTIDVVSMGTPPSYPVTLYIERETFTATGNTGDQFTGVTRAKFGSVKRHHAGYNDEDGYRPIVSTYPRFWADRWAKLCVVVDGAITGGDPSADSIVWQGPISNVGPTGLTGWEIRVGSVMRVINKKKIFEDAKALELASPIDVTTPSGVTFLGSLMNISLVPAVERVRSGVTLTANGTKTTAISTGVVEPDRHWNSNHSLQWTSGDNYNSNAILETITNGGKSHADQSAIVQDWDVDTNTFTIADQENTTDSGDTCDILKWNTYPPSSFMDAFWVVVDNELMIMRMFDLAGEGIGISAEDRWAVLRSYVPHINDHGGRIPPGLEGSVIEKHDTGTAVKEVLSNFRYDYGDLLKQETGAITLLSALDDKSLAKMPVIHPVRWLLEVMTSTGDGWNGSLDVLPAHHGASIPADWINAASFNASLTTGPVYRLAYLDATSLKDIIATDICAPLGLYPGLDKDGKFELKRAQFMDPSASVATITESHILSDSQPMVTTDHASVLSKVTYNFDWWPQDKQHYGSLGVKWTDAERMYELSGEQTFDTHVWLGVGSTEGKRITHEAFADSMKNVALRMLRRSSSPLWILTVSLPMMQSLGTRTAFELRPGDICTVTLGAVPLPDGTRGLSSDTMEVIGVTLDPMKGTITVDLWLSLYDNVFGKWNFGVEVASWAAGTDTVTVDTDLFQDDTDVTDYVTAGDKIRIHYTAMTRQGTAPYGTTEELTVDSVTADSITFTASPAQALVAGDVVAAGDYDVSTTAQKTLAYFAEANDSTIIGDETVGAADDPPYVWV